MAKWKCEICGNEFEHFHAQGFDNKIYCPLCYFKKENQELKKQLQERPKEYVFIGNAQNKTRDFINQITKDNKEFKNQQKEFIEYMNKTIEELECDDVDDEEMKGYLIQRIDTFKEILSKYKSIIGSDINVGSKGDERNEKIK